MATVISPKEVCLFIPGNLKKFKLDLFNRIAKHIEKLGGQVVRSDMNALVQLCDERDLTPIIGCQPEATQPILGWKAKGKRWIYWDRGYARRVFATWLPRGADGGYYRWHVDSFQLEVMFDAPPDRWAALNMQVYPWQKNGKHVVVLSGSVTYDRFHRTDGWTERMLHELSLHTDRQIVVRDKESKRSLQSDLAGAHVAISHGSIAAVEAVILGCPVVVDKESAAALVGLTDITKVEHPVYPERAPWLNALAYTQFNEAELVDGTLWKLLR